MRSYWLFFLDFRSFRYFSAMIHAVPAGWRRVAVVTSDFHMPRSRAIFEKVYGLVERSLGIRVELEFVSVTDAGVVDDKVRDVRMEKEAKSVRCIDLATWHRVDSHEVLGVPVQQVATWQKNMVRELTLCWHGI